MSFCKVMIIGNLGRDPEIRYFPDGKPIATLSVATTDTWKDKETGEKQQRAEWHRCVLKDRLAEIAGEYLFKGSKVYLEGTNRTRKWKDDKGVERFTTEVVCHEMTMLDSPGRSSDSSQTAKPQHVSESPSGQTDDMPF